MEYSKFFKSPELKSKSLEISPLHPSTPQFPLKIPAQNTIIASSIIRPTDEATDKGFAQKRHSVAVHRARASLIGFPPRDPQESLLGSLDKAFQQTMELSKYLWTLNRSATKLLDTQDEFPPRGNDGE